MNPIPNSVVELIEELEEMFPPACKDPNETLEQHARYAGRVELIEEIRTRYDWTQQNAKVSDL